MNRLGWIFEIEDYEKHLADKLDGDEDLKLLHSIQQRKTGTEAFLEIASTFLKTNIKVVERPFNELKKVYVYQKKNEPVTKLARKLNLDERTIYSWLAEFGVKRNGNGGRGEGRGEGESTIDLFEE